MGTPESMPRSQGDFEIWDSVAASGQEPYRVWDFFRRNVDIRSMNDIRGVIFLADRAVKDVDPFYLNQLFTSSGGGCLCSMDVTDLRESEHCNIT